MFGTLKKANCHLHITGALKPQDLRYLAKIANIDISNYEPLEKHINFFDPVIWSIAKEVTSISKSLTEAIKIILKREADDNVIYVELTINPVGMIRRGMISQEIIESIQEGFLYGESLGIKSKAKFGVNRKDGPDSVAIVKDIYDMASEKLKVGIDLNGDEQKFKTYDFVESFKKLASEKIPTSVHAGEYAGLCNSLKEAISMNPARISHAISIVEDEALFNKIIENNIIIEVSPISNIKTGAITDIKTHPIKKFVEYKVPIIFGSDDPAFFDATVSSELESLVGVGIDIDKILELNQQVFKTVGYYGDIDTEHIIV